MFNRRRFEHLDQRLDKLELYFTIRDPGTSKSAEAYEGLRKSLIAAYKGTQSHMAHLAQLHRAATTADSLDPVVAKLGEFMEQVGVVEISDPSQVGLDPRSPSFTEFFDLTAAEGGHLVIDQSAYVSVQDGAVEKVVSRGVAHWEESPQHDGTSDLSDGSPVSSDGYERERANQGDEQ